MNLRVITVAVVLLGSCGKRHPEPVNVVTTSPEPVRAPSSTQKGSDASGVNRTVDPCTDFYEFSNGAWRTQNPIPEGKPRWGRRDVAREANKQNVRSVIQDAAARTDWPAGSAQQIVGDFYAACTDEAAADAAGLAPIAPLLAEIDAAKSQPDIQRMIRRLHDLGIAAAFGATGAFDNREPMNFQLNLVAGGLGLERDVYLKSDPKLVEARTAYRQRVAKVLALGGMAEKSTLAAADD